MLYKFYISNILHQNRITNIKAAFYSKDLTASVMNFIALSANCNHFWEFSILVRDHSSITSAKKWMGGVRNADLLELSLIRTWMNDSNEKSLFRETI